MPIKLINTPENFLDIEINENIENVDISIDFSGSNISKDLLNYSILIKFDSSKEDKNYSNKFKEITGLKFSPYDYKNNTYKFFTSKYTSPNKEVRLNILKEILNSCEEQVLINKINEAKSNEYFDNNFHKIKTFETDDLICVPIKDLNSIAAIPKRFLNTDGFSKYRKISSDFKKHESLNLETLEILKAEAPNYFKPNSSIFLIDKTRLYDFMNVVEHDNKEKENFTEAQLKIGQNENLSRFNITEKNPFDLKINYIEEGGYFDFYCKGYIDSFSPFGDMAPKSCLARLALNYILLTDNENLPDISQSWDIKVDGAYKVNFKCLATSSNRLKSLHVPADQFEKIKIIFDNYNKSKELFGREAKQIKIPYRSLSVESAAENYPFIHFNDDGKAYLIYQVRHSNINSKNDFMTLKGISINQSEVNDFLFNHPLSSKILEGTKYVLCGLTNEPTFSEQSKEELFSKTYEVYNLRNSLVTNEKPKRKMKI